MEPPQRLPDPVDPASPPRLLARAATAAIVIGVALLLLGALVAIDSHDGIAVAPLLLLGGWLLSLPIAIALLVAYNRVGHGRVHRYERSAGFLPRTGRTALPASGRRTLFRVEHARRGDQLCLMVAHWEHDGDCWQRRGVVDHRWVEANDAAAVAAQRERLQAVAEELEAGAPVA